MDRKFLKQWEEFIDSKYDVGNSRKKTAWNFQRFLESKLVRKGCEIK